MVANTSKRAGSKARPRPALSSVLRCDNPGQLSVPTQLGLGSDGKFYLAGSGEGGVLKFEPQIITLKESVAWFRVGHQCGLNLIQGESFNTWLRKIEEALP